MKLLYLAPVCEHYAQTHADICVVGCQYLVMFDHNKPVNVFGCVPKVGLKHVNTINAIIIYDECKKGQAFILLIY